MTETLFLVYSLFSLVILIYVTTVFLIAQLRADNSVMDIFYGPAFAVAAWVTIYLLQSQSVLAHTLAGLITLWATRLCLRIARKNWGKPEDARYAAWRSQWTTRGKLYFILRSYIQINLLQGIIITIVALPVIIALTVSTASLTVITYLGIVVFAIGLAYESLADWQLDRYIANKRAGLVDDPLMRTGLFRYSRRPNYFGESLIWWGLAIMVLPLPLGYLALLSPLLITFIVTRVTGPMLENIFLEKHPEEYRAYMARTSYFIPWFPK